MKTTNTPIPQNKRKDMINKFNAMLSQVESLGKSAAEIGSNGDFNLLLSPKQQQSIPMTTPMALQASVHQIRKIINYLKAEMELANEE